MFSVHDFDIVPPEQAVLEIPIDNEVNLLLCKMDNFDRDGYEFLPIEKCYYETNGYQLYYKDVFAKESGNPDGWYSLIHNWIQSNIESDFIFIDHSYCLQSFKFVGRAYEQIKKMSKFRPELLKLLQSKIKYGTDFCIDVVIEDKIFEALHFEWDFSESEYHKFLSHKQYCEERILEINWLEFSNTIIEKYPLFRFDQDIDTFKARQFGLDKANKLIKRF